MSNLSDSRRRALKLKGVLALRISTPPIVDHDSLRWHLGPPEDGSNIFGFIDGPAFDANYLQNPSCGFALIAVDTHGVLVAVAGGRPPAWIDSAGGAEVWAFYQITALVHTPLGVFTDYLEITKALYR